MNNHQNNLAQCENDVTGTNLLLAQLLLKTTDEKTNLSENPALLSIVQSLSKMSELFFSRSTPLQWTPNVKDQSRAVSDSSTSSTCNSSLTWPSSVHVADVTHGPCAAYEHTASHGVSETAIETNVNCGIILGDTEGMSSSALQSNGSPRKRPSVTINDTNMAVSHPSKRLHQEPNDKSHFVHPITSVSRLKEYIEQTKTVAKSVMEDKENIQWNAAQHVNDSDECQDALISSKERASPENFIANNKVVRLIAVERTLKTGQVYVASGLNMKYHFSSPTVFLPYLYEAIQCINNPNVELTFVPRTVTLCNIEGSIKVINNIEFKDSSIYEECHDIHDAIIGKQSSMVTKALGTTSKRSKYSISIGLQMMHSHTQHLARYCMLSHSKPHVPNVKMVPGLITDRIISMYALVSDIISESLTNDDMHPLALDVTNTPGDALSHRKGLRSDLLHHFSSRMANDIDLQTMFESCSLQPTASLGFHMDALNCPDIDNTIACFVPCLSCDDTDSDPKCLSFLFYSRKCVGAHVKRMAKIEEYIRSPQADQLAKLCVRSIMHVGGIFDYQGSLFEATDSMKTILKKLKCKKAYCCPEVEEYTGLSCFKHGASFDKMGYYSIFLNVFCSLYYIGCLENLNDAISLSMYFGLLCNGTSSLAAVWKQLEKQKNGALKYISSKRGATRLFRLLVKLERCKFEDAGGSVTNGKHLLHGNCKAPRFQYPNYANVIMDDRKDIHRIIREFLDDRTNKNVSTFSVADQHANLFDRLKKKKGIGPLSFNQLWHSMCLCGLLPHHYIDYSVVSPNAGPAKLIQVFHPGTKSVSGLLRVIAGVKGELQKLGFGKVTEFFLENMLCELWRILTSRKLRSRNSSTEGIKEILVSDNFQTYMKDSSVTRFPDVYYNSPFTKECQHIFRVMDKTLYMRPSFLDNVPEASVLLQCSVTYDKDGLCQLKWVGGYLKKNGMNAGDLFVKERITEG